MTTIDDSIKKWMQDNGKKKVVIFGADMVAAPVVEELSKTNSVLVIDRDPVALESVVKKSHAENTYVVVHDFQQGENIQGIQETECAVNDLIKNANIVVSLLPPSFHPKIAERCIGQGTDMVTASYISDEMRALEQSAKQAGIVIVNECGVDPGIDHMSAMKIFDQIHSHGGRVSSFASYCGGLPSNATNNPFGYQFSWSPKGVLTASKNSATYLKDRRIRTIQSGKLFLSSFQINIPGAGVFEGYYNRDSTIYAKIYGIKPETLIRGTLRHSGWCVSLQQLQELGWLDDTKRKDISGNTYGSLCLQILGTEIHGGLAKDPIAIKEAVADELGIGYKHPTLEKLTWLGLFSDKKIPDDLDFEIETPIDALAYLMQQRMPYEDGQTDMIVMHHTIGAQYPDHEDIIHSTMVYHGDPNGHTAMEATVGLPVAYATQLILDGITRESDSDSDAGLIMPLSSKFYDPILDKLSSQGIQFHEEVINNGGHG